MNLFRRHTKDCSKGYGQYDRAGLNCTCTVWVEGKLPGGFIRQSTKTRSMQRARQMLVAAEQRGSWPTTLIEISTQTGTDRMPVFEAVAAFLASAADSRGKNLSEPTVDKYRTSLGQLQVFCEANSLTFIDEISYSHLQEHKAEWKTGPQATANRIARLKSFWKHAVLHDWCGKNPAAKLQPPKNYQFTEREPYTDEEMELILSTARTIKLDKQQQVGNIELETFFLVMRYSGMAIADAALFGTHEIKGDEVRYFRKKTMRSPNRKLVVVPLPAFLMARIRALPIYQGKYIFCHGLTTIEAATDVWHKRCQQVFRAADISKGHCHRFRHTFAYDLLSQHVPIELVSRYLGHRSIAVTQRYYSAYLEGRIQADSDVLRKLYSTVDKSS